MAAEVRRLLVVMVLTGMSNPAEAARYTIAIENMAYGKAPPSLQMGDTIIWQNKDIFEHSATARSGAFDVDVAPGKEGQVKLKQPGQVEVFCRYHPTMTLKLVVGKRNMK